jgi:hypothetical protein
MSAPTNNLMELRSRRVASILTVLLVASGSVAAGMALPAAASSPAPRPAHITILVDESPALSDQDVKLEFQAAQTVVSSELAATSLTSIFGYGNSAEGSQPGLEPICEPQEVGDPALRSRTFLCLQQSDPHDRATVNSGPSDADPANALAQADRFNYMGGNDRRIIILLTGTKGALSVPSAGTLEQRAAELPARLRQTAAGLRKDRIEVWPVGFAGADHAVLTALARQAYQPVPGCPDAPEATPSARFASSPTKLSETTLSMLKTARCRLVGDPGNGGITAAALLLIENVALLVILVALATVVIAARRRERRRRAAALAARAPRFLPVAGLTVLLLRGRDGGRDTVSYYTADESDDESGGESGGEPELHLRLRLPGPGLGGPGPKIEARAAGERYDVAIRRVDQESVEIRAMASQRWRTYRIDGRDAFLVGAGELFGLAVAEHPHEYAGSAADHRTRPAEGSVT